MYGRDSATIAPCMKFSRQSLYAVGARGVRAVSYTHLDVYKRQEDRLADTGFLLSHFTIFNSGISNNAIFSKHDEANAYAHTSHNTFRLEEP